MGYKKKYSIFISSTYEDLIEERQAILGVALENDYIPVGMEQFHAYPASQWDIITKMIDECDAYLLIIGGRYGSVDKSSGFSYTEKEYNYAKSKGIPVLALIRRAESITQDKMDSGDEKLVKQQKLEEFREKVKQDNRTVDFFTTVDSLKYAVTQALKNARAFCGEESGWVRYSDIQDIINKRVEEQNNIRLTVTQQQEEGFQKMEDALAQISKDFEDVKNNQLTWQEIEPISKEEIEQMFSVEGETLHIRNPKK